MVIASSQPTLFDRPDAWKEGLASAYVPILVDKRGERRALRAASSEVRDGMVPLIQLLPAVDRTPDEVASSPREVIARLRDCARGRLVYLDPGGVARATRRSPRMSPSDVEAHYREAVRQELAFVPVLTIGRSDTAALTGEVARATQFGMAVRVRLAETIYAGLSVAAGVIGELDNLGLSDIPTDLILDLGYLDLEQEVSPGDVLAQVREFQGAASWRTVTLASTTVPRSYSDRVDEGQRRLFDRLEWSLYTRVIELGGTLRYGDYGIQNPVPPDPMRVNRMVASIRFPTRDAIAVARGTGTMRTKSSDEKVAEYRALAVRIMELDGFVGRSCCPGDRLVEEVADGLLAIRAPHRWREAGTLHALYLTTGLLSQLRRPSRRLPSSRRRAEGAASPIITN